MKLDTNLGVDFGASFSKIIETAQRAERNGYDCLWSSETTHDPFWPLMIAAEHTTKLNLGTSIAVAFARSPTTLAHLAWDAQSASNGRFILGLGTQIKPHIERRFGMVWDHPAPRLREYILAIRALWDSWQTGAPLNFRGEFFKLTLMTPFFNPGPIAHPAIPIYIAGVNEHLCQLAGELCDGFHVHPFHTPKYLAEYVLPNIDLGAHKAGRTRAACAITTSVFAIAGDTPEERAASRAAVRQQISFYASTPSYRVVMDLHGWADAALQLGALASKARWAEMPAVITDDMLAVFAEEGAWAELPAKIARRYAGLLDRVALYVPQTPEAEATVARGFVHG